MPSQYTPETPTEPQVPDTIIKFFETFYKISDTPDAHEQYADCFTEDGVMILASKRVEGRDELLTLRRSLWTSISSRAHKPHKLIPFKSPLSASSMSAEREVMLYGTVKYGFKDGGRDEKDWAARAVLIRGGSGESKGGEGKGGQEGQGKEGERDGGDGGREGWRMRFYQVYLDTGGKK